MLQYGTRCQFDCFKWDETIREAVMKSMQGTPYHVEALRRNEDDPRRYWGRCRLVDFNTQMCLLRGKSTLFARVVICMIQSQRKNSKNDSDRSSIRNI